MISKGTQVDFSSGWRGVVQPEGEGGIANVFPGGL